MSAPTRRSMAYTLVSVVATLALQDPCFAQGAKPSAQTGGAQRGSSEPVESDASDEVEHPEAEAIDRPRPPKHPVPVSNQKLNGDEREVPDYDGRGDEPTTLGDVALWVPRVLLSPLYLVSEFVVRRPLGWLVTTAEENKWPAIIFDFLTFGPDRQAGIIPTGLVDFGLRPSIGLYFFWNDAFASGNALRMRVAWGGEDWLMLSGTDRIDIGNRQTVAFLAGFERRPDQVFYGLGPNANADDRGRYGRLQVQGGVEYVLALPRSSRLVSRLGVRDVKTDAEQRCCGNPSVARRIGQGRYPVPPGLDEEYTLAYERLELDWDTRPRRQMDQVVEASDFFPAPGSGLRLSLRAEHSSVLSTHDARTTTTRSSWIRYGGTLGGFVDLTGEQRSLGIMLVTEFVDPLTDRGEIPFTEQVRLGGSFVMRGGLEGRLVDRSAAVARLEYQWPVWVWMDGAAFYELGNVFGEHLDGFALHLLRSSFGFGLRSIGARDNPFETMLAFQTETFAQGHSVETVRFVFGTTSGF